MNPGKFITFEGIEGTGKSTNIRTFCGWLEAAKVPHLLTREPGGTPIAEDIRQVLLKDYDETMAADTETLLFYAARAQHVANKVKPALAEGTFVICDRFYDATLAYQGAGREEALERVKVLNEWVLKGFAPDLTILLDAPVEVGLGRIAARNALDRIEKEKADFFERVRSCYLSLAEKEPARFRVVDASQDLAQVQANLRTIFDEIVDDQ